MVHDFGNGRAFVDIGALILAKANPDGSWFNDGEPARMGPELDLFNHYMKARLGTTVTVTDPSGTVTTFADEGGSVKR